MTPAGELLQAARDYALRGKCEGAEARMEDGTPVDPSREEAKTFSVYGALKRAAYDRRDSTGIDTAMMLLGRNETHDPMMTGFSRLEDDDLRRRFDEALERAEGGPIKEPSVDAQRKMLDPTDPDYLEKFRDPAEKEATNDRAG